MLGVYVLVALLCATSAPVVSAARNVVLTAQTITSVDLSGMLENDEFEEAGASVVLPTARTDAVTATMKAAGNVSIGVQTSIHSFFEGQAEEAGVVLPTARTDSVSASMKAAGNETTGMHGHMHSPKDGVNEDAGIILPTARTDAVSASMKAAGNVSIGGEASFHKPNDVEEGTDVVLPTARTDAAAATFKDPCALVRTQLNSCAADRRRLEQQLHYRNFAGALPELRATRPSVFNILSTTMPEDQVTIALIVAERALELYDSEVKVAEYLKRQFDSKYFYLKGHWHAIVGMSFGTFITFDYEYIHFTVGPVEIVLFRTLPALA